MNANRKKMTGSIVAAVCMGMAGSALAGYNEDYSSRFGAGAGKDIVRQAEDLGVHWGRCPADVPPECVSNMFMTYTLMDTTLTNYQAHGVVAYGVINPARNIATSNWPTPAEYAVIVSNLVERYDGDGINDMPGLLYPIRTWELMNEYSSTFPNNPFQTLGQSNFIAMVIMGRQAIKAACPDALFAYDPFDMNDTRALFLQMNPTNVEIVSYHTYVPLDAAQFPESPTYLKNLPALMQSYGLTNQPVWATEYAMYEHTGATPTQMGGTQEDNARWFVQTTVWAFGSNLLQKIIYTEIEPPRENLINLQWMALTDSNGVPRQIYYAYKKLASMIDKYSSKQILSLGADLYGFQFTVNATNVYVMWSKGGTGAHTNVALTGLTGMTATVTISVPDTNGIFTTSTVAISNGRLTLDTLGETPVYIVANPDMPEPPLPPAPVCADYDGDGKADPAIYNTNGTWKIKLSSTPDYTLVTLSDFLGNSGFSALAADFDGDKFADPAVYNAELEFWQVKLSSARYLVPIDIFSFGGNGWEALAGDFDGDGKADPAIYSTNGTWKIKLSSGNYSVVPLADFFGGNGYTAMAADFDGDRKADPAIYGESSGIWAIKLSSASYITLALTQTLGGTGYIPAPADYDGDGLADPAVKSESGNEWIIMLSTGNYTPVPLTLLFE